MRIYRTPDSRFDNLPGWPFEPRYLVQDDLRMHSYDAPYRSIERFADELDLHAVTLVVHDWGGPIGFRLAVEHPRRIDRLVVLNTGIGTAVRSTEWLRFRAVTRGVDTGIDVGN